MQQSCVDNVLMGNYSEYDNTEAVNDVTDEAVRRLIDYRCDPFDCNRHGHCVNGECVCDSGWDIVWYGHRHLVSMDFQELRLFSIGMRFTLVLHVSQMQMSESGMILCNSVG